MYCASAAKCAAVLAGRTEEEEEEEEKPEKSLLIYANLFWVTVTFRAKFNNLFFCKLVVPGKPLSHHNWKIRKNQHITSSKIRRRRLVVKK